MNQTMDNNGAKRSSVGRKPKPNMKRVVFSIEENINNRLSEHSVRSGMERSTIVSKLLLSYLEEAEREDLRDELARKLIQEGVGVDLVSRVTGISTAKLKMF